MTLLRFYPGWWRQSTHKKNLLHVVGYLVVVGYLIESRKSRHGGQAEGRKEGHPLENYIIYSCIIRLKSTTVTSVSHIWLFCCVISSIKSEILSLTDFLTNT